jgi:hypothetical protein
MALRTWRFGGKDDRDLTMTERSRRLTATFCALCLVVVGIAACAPTEASASTYFVTSCDSRTHDASSFGRDWKVTGLGPGWFPSVDCPYGISFASSAPMYSGRTSASWFETQSDSRLVDVEFEYFGGGPDDAYRYSVKRCAYQCEEIALLQPGVTEAAPFNLRLDTRSLEIGSIAIVAQCVQAICPAPAPLIVRNFRFEYEDGEPPTISDVSTDPVGATDSQHRTWIRGRALNVSFNASDGGSGVSSGYAGIDSLGDLPLPLKPCSMLGARLCPAQQSVSTKLDLAEVPDGIHQMMVSVSDASGRDQNERRLEQPLGVDNTPPAEPVGIQLAGNVTKWGWTSSGSIDVSHGDPLIDSRNTAASGWGSAEFDLRRDPNAEPSATSTVNDWDAPAAFKIPQEGRWDVGVTYRDVAGNLGNRGHRFIGFDTGTPGPPSPIPLNWTTRADLKSGMTQRWNAPAVDPALESGICAYSVRVDDERFGIPDLEPEVDAPGTSIEILPSTGEGRHFAHVRSIACNGVGSATATVPMNVDGTAPTAVLRGLPDSHWMPDAAKVAILGEDNESGVAAIQFAIDDPADVTVRTGAATSVDLPEGAHTLYYRAVDNAGNTGSFGQRAVNVDRAAPYAAAPENAPAGSNRIVATVTDADSGVAALGIQIRRADTGVNLADSTWQALGAFSDLGAPGLRVASLTREIADEDLAAGHYEVRVAARDIAGNWTDSPPLALALPLRQRPVLAPAIGIRGPKASDPWRGAARERVVRFGRRVVLLGSLVDAVGDPIPGAELGLTKRPEFGVATRMANVVTDRVGQFAVRLPPGPTTTFTLRFAGNDKYQMVEESAIVRSRASLDLKLSPGRVRSGQAFTLSGRLLSGDLGLPEGDKIVTIEYLRRNRWIPTIATPPVGDHGRFKATWPDGISATRPTTVWFRASAKRDAMWPFLTGSSKPVPLRLRP